MTTTATLTTLTTMTATQTMTQQSVITIGIFDGVHLGHQAIVGHARALARERGVRVVAVTFEPHPARTLRPEAEPPKLLHHREKVRRLRAIGADEVIVLEPTRELLSQTAEQFIERLVEQYRPLAFIEGEDFRFGKGRAGDMNVLQRLGRRWGFEARVQPRVAVALSNYLRVPVSSSLVRWLVGHGRVRDTALCLGALFELSGPVVTGEQRGRTIGVPTANLAPEAFAEFIVPFDGVYAGTAVLPDGRSFAAALSVGTKPAFGEHPLTIEAHLLDFAGDLYDQTVTLRFARWLRDQAPFPGIASLKRQLARDIETTRHWHRLGLLESAGPGGHSGRQAG